MAGGRVAGGGRAAGEGCEKKNTRVGRRWGGERARARTRPPSARSPLTLFFLFKRPRAPVPGCVCSSPLGHTLRDVRTHTQSSPHCACGAWGACGRRGVERERARGLPPARDSSPPNLITHLPLSLFAATRTHTPSTLNHGPLPAVRDLRRPAQIGGRVPGERGRRREGDKRTQATPRPAPHPLPPSLLPSSSSLFSPTARRPATPTLRSRPRPSCPWSAPPAASPAGRPRSRTCTPGGRGTRPFPTRRAWGLPRLTARPK